MTNTNGDTWNVNDAADPGMDTGSIHNTGTNSLQGYGGLRVKVPGAPRMNGVLLRGFGLTADSATQYTSKRAVQLGGVAIKRSIAFNTAEAYARYLDTFTNTTGAPLTIEVAFGGQLGYDTGTNQSAIASTSSGDTTLTPADKWTVSYSPSAGVGSATVNGTSATVPGTFDRTGNFLRDPFAYAHATTGDHANHIGYVNTLTHPGRRDQGARPLRRDRPVGDARVRRHHARRGLAGRGRDREGHDAGRGAAARRPRPGGGVRAGERRHLGHQLRHRAGATRSARSPVTRPSAPRRARRTTSSARRSRSSSPT